MKKISGVYIIQSISRIERYYIGSSINIGRRIVAHKTDLRGNKHHSISMQRHFNKYGESDFKFEILEECENIIEREQFYINTLNPKFNICKIAGSFIGYNHTEESKKKMSLSKKGRSPWNKGKVGLQEPWNKGKKMPEEQRLNLLNHIVSEETRKKISISKTGCKQSKESIEKRRKSLFVPVVKLSMFDEIIEEYGSIQEAAEKNNIPKTAISRCVRKELNHYKKYKWAYKKLISPIPK